MRYLVTGGSGFVGGHLCRALLARGHHCVSVDIRAPRQTPHHPRLTHDFCDLGNVGEVEELFRRHGPFDAVFHCASRRSYRLGDYRSFLRSNVHATRYMAEACIRHDARNLVFLSSSAVYGHTGKQPVSEAYPLMPIEAFGKTRLASENMLWAMGKQLNSVMLRVPTVVGTGEPGRFHMLFELLREGGRIWIPGNGKNHRQLVWIGDLTDACCRAAQHHRSAVFNIGARQVPTQNMQIVELMSMFDQRGKIMHLPAWVSRFCRRLVRMTGMLPACSYTLATMDESYVGDISAAESELGWKPTKNNVDMLHTAFDDYRQSYRRYLEERQKNRRSMLQPKPAA